MSFSVITQVKRVNTAIVIVSLIIGLTSIFIFGKYSSNRNNPPPEESKAATPQIVSQGASRFEPPNGKAFYGMGQEFDYTSGVFNGRYTNETQPGICLVYSKNGIRPRLLSGYMGLSQSNAMTDILGRVNTINSKEGNYYVPIIAIATFPVADGLRGTTYDATLRTFGAQVKAYGKPVFIRPVYEINEYGESGQKYIDKYGLALGKQYAIADYKKVVTLMREGAGGDLPNVAWVWHVVAEGLNNSYYDTWFPGNRYVDWVGVSQFSAGYGSNQVTDLAPVTFANSKGLPVIISESAPVIKSDGTSMGINDPNVVTQFFNPYFANIENSANHIKAFAYTNNDYTGVFPGWGDERIQSNPSVVTKFVTETAKAYFQVPVDALRIGQKPYEMSGITGGWQSNDGILHIISGDKYWELNSSNVWTKADNIQNVAPFNSIPTAARINGLAPWEGGGITAIWFDPSENNRYLRIISGGNRFYRYDYQTSTWLTTGNPWLDSTNNWSKAPSVNGLKPWDGTGISAVWIASDNYMRVISKDRFYRQNLVTGVWDTAPGTLGVLPLGNALWSSAPVVDGVQPWQGSGITAAWIKDGHILQLKSKDKYWDWDLNITTVGANWISSGNYRDGDYTNIWKKAPFIEIAGAPQPSTNQTAACPLPATATPSPTPTGTATKTPTPTPTKTPTPTATKTSTPTPTSSFTPTKSPTPTPSNTITFTPTPTATKSPTPTQISTGTNTPTGTATATNTQTATPTLILGDANGDGKVDGIDYTIWLTHYGTNISGSSNGDFNTDGKVDGVDFVIWFTHYGTGS